MSSSDTTLDGFKTIRPQSIPWGAVWGADEYSPKAYFVNKKFDYSLKFPSSENRRSARREGAHYRADIKCVNSPTPTRRKKISSAANRLISMPVLAICCSTTLALQKHLPVAARRTAMLAVHASVHGLFKPPVPGPVHWRRLAAGDRNGPVQSRPFGHLVLPGECPCLQSRAFLQGQIGAVLQDHHNGSGSGRRIVEVY